jgi:hypothetical protein
MITSLVALGVNVFGGMAVKMLTERFISRLVIIALRECSKRTANKWDDELVALVVDEVAPDMKNEKQ